VRAKGMMPAHGLPPWLPRHPLRAYRKKRVALG